MLHKEISRLWLALAIIVGCFCIVAMMYPGLKIPLLVFLAAMLLCVPTIRGCIHLRKKWMSQPGRRSKCPRCGYRRQTVDSASCPKCFYTTARDDLRSNESVALPCPTCQYDLRGLTDGQCPECGTPFLVADLEPEQPGLVLESWHEAAKTLVERATLPLVIAFSPIRAFRRRCDVNEILQGSPARTFLWCILWFGAILVVSVGIHFGLDKLQGMRLVFGSSYWNYPGASRFGSVAMLPVDVPIAWVECLLVSCLGIAIAIRPLSLRQIARLATWLFALTLLAGTVSTVYELIYQRVLAPNLFVLPIDTEWCFRLMKVGRELTYRSFDIVLGLTAGFAVGTVLQRRRWPIAITAAVSLAVAFPALASIQSVYAMSVYHPLCELVLGPPEMPTPGPMLLLGPTFKPGTSTPALAGTWSVRYDNAGQPEVHLSFDSVRGLTRLKVARSESGNSGEFLADGEQHKAPLPDGNHNVDAIHYRVLSGAEHDGDSIVLHVRLERTYMLTIRDDFFQQIPDITEETLSGVLSDDGNVITGTSVTVRDVPRIEFQPGEQTRSFIMERVRRMLPEP